MGTCKAIEARDRSGHAHMVAQFQFEVGVSKCASL